MYLRLSPRPSEEAVNVAPEQLELIITNIEKKKQKLEEDIARYIKDKQHALNEYEQTLLGNMAVPSTASLSQIQPLSNKQPSAPAPDSMPITEDSLKSIPTAHETVKPHKPTRVHKREMELRGLMAFIPLLEANDAAASRQKKTRSKSRETRSDAAVLSPALGESPRSSASDCITDPGEGGEQQKNVLESEQTSMADVEGKNGASAQKKKKSAAESKRKGMGKRKSSLRRSPSTNAVHRKRVSLVIDDQIVHPSDSLVVTSPLSDSTANVSSSMEDLQEVARTADLGPLHHSLPTSPDQTPPTALSTSPPSLQFDPPQTATETSVEHDERLPRSPDEEALAIYAEEPAAPVSTYVGGLSGSGVDDVDQAGSYGYPSSLGASYMESYMASRPLSVRVAAAEKAELEEEEAKKLVRAEPRADVAVGRVEEMDLDDGFLGEMENI